MAFPSKSPPPTEVAALATSSFITIPSHCDVAQSIVTVRTAAKRGHIFYLYVVDHQKRLCGIVSIRNLLVSPDAERVSHIMSAEVVTLADTTPLKEAYSVFAKSRFLSLPIVDAERHIVGVVHAHDLVSEYGKRQEELFEERSRGELFELLGIKAETSKRRASQVALGRLPWLLINLLGGLLSAAFIHRWSGSLTYAVEFLSLVPVLLVIAESIGMQTASVVIGQLQGPTSRATLTSRMRREVLVALQVSLLFTVGLSLLVLAWYQNSSLALSIGLTVPIASLWVCLLAGLVPTLFHRMRLDPRISAGPVLLAVADCSTLLLYLAVAHLLTRLL